MAESNHPEPQDVFAIVDTMDIEKLATLFTEDARVTFGTEPPYVGQSAIRDGAKGFFSTTAGIQHTVVRVWHVGEKTVAHLHIRHQRKDGNHATVPAAAIYRVDGDGKIDDYRLFLLPVRWS